MRLYATKTRSTTRLRLEDTEILSSSRDADLDEMSAMRLEPAETSSACISHHNQVMHPAL